MYLPQAFAVADQKRIRSLIEQNSLATVLSFPQQSTPFINHLPIVFSGEQGKEEILLGHMSRKNPQWMHFKENPNCTMIFHGPHAYITPSWYNSGRDVPTWNYAVVHVHGTIELRESYEDQIATLSRLTEVFETPREKPWQFELPADLNSKQTLTAAIISFKFRIEKVDAKFKLAQTRPTEDRRGVIEGLMQTNTDMARAMGKMMLELEE